MEHNSTRGSQLTVDHAPLGILPEQIYCDGWSIGYDDRFPHSQRVQQAFVYARFGEHENLYAHPMVRRRCSSSTDTGFIHYFFRISFLLSTPTPRKSSISVRGILVRWLCLPHSLPLSRFPFVVHEEDRERDSAYYRYHFTTAFGPGRPQGLRERSHPCPSEALRLSSRSHGEV